MYKSLILFFLIFVLSTLCFSATINIPADYPTIQQGIIAAVNGDTVLVAPGTYNENINFTGKAITVKSSDSPLNTTIKGKPYCQVVRFRSGEKSDSILIGFTITNNCYGGIECYSSSPTIMDNIITGITASSSAGIRCFKSSSIIIDNIIMGNKTSYLGGGAGISCTMSSPIIVNNTIYGNTATFGGGISCDSSSPTITNNIIFENTADVGGGIFLNNCSKMTILNNTIFSNNVNSGNGGGIYFNGCFGAITNTIFWNNSAATGPEMWIGKTNYPSILTVNNSDVKGGQSSVYIEPNSILNWGPGMIDSDPLFVDPVNFDLHLTYSSPCRNTGDNSAITKLYDLENDPRIVDGTVDMGADEFHRHLYWTGDATPGANIELKFIDTPNTSPVILWLGSGVMDPPIHLMNYGDWYLKFPILFEGQFGSIPGPDGVLALPFTIPTNIPTPLSLPMQALSGSKLTNLSVLEIE